MLKDWSTIVRVTDNRRAVVSGIEKEVKERMKQFPPCHDWWHIERVRNLGRHIAIAERADIYIVDLTLLLHDGNDLKFQKGNALCSAHVAREVMQRHGVRSSVVTNEVCDIIAAMSFRNGKNPMPTLEGKVAQDADMLDAMGAIGIARVFTTGAYKNQPIFTPGEHRRTSEEMLLLSMGPPSTIAHFHEKLLLLKKRMNTREGKRLAKRRHATLSKFLYRFHQEWKLEE